MTRGWDATARGDGGNVSDKGKASAGGGKVPRAIWTLGFVSMLMDVSSEMIHGLLPIYLVTVLGASMATVGLIEGMAEATASIVKIFSGALSDRLGKRKLLAALGYGLAAFTKPVFPLASSLGWIVAARFVDRVGKGIRGAPRDALIADISPADARGASFGLRQTLDTIGAFTGPLLAIGLMWMSGDNFTLVFWLAAIPGFLSFALIAFAVREPERAPGEASKTPVFAALTRLGPAYWRVVAVAALFTLARFSEAFLILRAQGAGLPTMLAPAVLVVMNVVYAVSAWPAGILSDRAGRFELLMLGLSLLVAADVVLALPGGGLWTIAAGIALWGLHMGFSQGILAAMVADAAPPDLRGTAFGWFNFFSGLATLGASVIAGMLWDAFGPGATFLAGAGMTGLAMLAALVLQARGGFGGEARS